MRRRDEQAWEYPTVSLGHESCLWESSSPQSDLSAKELGHNTNILRLDTHIESRDMGTVDINPPSPLQMYSIRRAPVPPSDRADVLPLSLIRILREEEVYPGNSVQAHFLCDRCAMEA